MHTVPNNSPTLQTPSPTMTLGDLKQLFLEVIQATSKLPEAVKPEAKEDAQAKAEIVRALKLEFKTVNEMYVPSKA